MRSIFSPAIDANTIKSDEIAMKPKDGYSISFINCIIVGLNFYIGVSTVESSRFNSCGIIGVLLINIIAAATIFYSIWMTICVSKELGTFSLEDAWEASHFKGKTFISLGTVISCVFFVVSYLSSIIKYAQLIRKDFFPTIPSFITDPYFISAILMITIYLPVYARTCNRYAITTSYAGLIITVMLFALTLYWFFFSVSKNGFDPNHKLSFFNIDGPLTNCFADYLGTYLNFMFSFTLFGYLEKPTAKMAKKVTICSMASVVVILTFFTTIQYFTIWDSFTEGEIMQYLPADASIILAYFLVSFKTVTIMPFYISPARDAILRLFIRIKRYPNVIYASTSMIVFLVAIVLSTTSIVSNGIAQAIISSITMLLQFNVPAIMFAKQMKKYSKIHWLGIAFLSIFGLGLCVELFLEI